MFLSMKTIPDLEKLYASLGERDYEAVMSHLANDIVWIVADNSPLADTPLQLCPISRGLGTLYTPGYASVPTDGSREAYRTGIMAKHGQNSASLTKSIDRLEWMREQMLTLQRALERVESNKRGQQIQRPTVRLK